MELIESGQTEFEQGVMKLFTSKINFTTNENNEAITSGNRKEITGKLELNITKKCYVRGIWVKFSAKSTIFRSEINSNKTIDLLSKENNENHHKDGIYKVFLGFGEYDDDNGELIEINIGNYEYLFSFHFSTNLPFSYCDKNVSTKYQIQVMFDCPEIAPTFTQVSNIIDYQVFSFLTFYNLN